MIRSVLIANRGEIAVRIIRACRDLNIKAVAVYSEADADALHVQMADDAVCIGPASTSLSYLNMQNIISAACLSSCDAIHPGVGFLSENAQFARKVEDAGLIFIGPRPETIELVGDKVQARATAEKAGIPLTPGSTGPAESFQHALETAEQIGYPIIIKAASGGGGRGMRIVENAKEMEQAFSIASNEALSFFADGRLYIEKYLRNPRHVEVQILSDGKGGVIHLGERDCSVQKNHQKLLEESPSTALTDKQRDAICKDAVKLFKKLEYRGAGTVEFLVYEGKHYFMEVNARVQVEHPVSEAISGIDIIVQQLRIASSKPLSVHQKQIELQGYALECRVNAKTPGTVSLFNPPLGPDVRVDTHLYTGSEVSPFYDPLAAKIIVRADTRELGIRKMLRALRELRIEGISTNVEEQLTILSSHVFAKGVFGTDVYEKMFQERS
jgi:acetyl-CoA carboxylase biotin carboxylase subunit